MRRRLTKAQVEALFATVDAPFDELVDAIAEAVALLDDSPDLDTALRRHDHHAIADRLAAGDEAAAWDLAALLNERRHL